MSGGFVFAEKPIQIDHGAGMELVDSEGTAYLDMGASYAVATLGHAHPAVTAAVREQAGELVYVQASYPVAVRTRLYELLAEIAPGDLANVWLCNSGTEANEAAMKFARAATGRSKIIATKRAFHGRTMGALALTWKQQYKDPFEPLVGDIEFVTYGDEAELAAAVDEETAAVFLEPIQGEGVGVRAVRRRPRHPHRREGGRQRAAAGGHARRRLGRRRQRGPRLDLLGRARRRRRGARDDRDRPR
jgi:acetylornithine/LysW-gamma-L-lysine aminotransferase